MKLRDLYEKLDSEARGRLAKKAEISSGYLWQLATQWKGKSPSVAVIGRLVAADRRLTVRELVDEFNEGEKPATAAAHAAGSDSGSSKHARA